MPSPYRGHPSIKTTALKLHKAITNLIQRGSHAVIIDNAVFEASVTDGAVVR